MKALIVGVKYQNMNYNLDNSLDELVELCKACQIQVVKRVVQKLEKINPSLFLGTGKVQEIKAELDDIDIVIFDEELTPLQVKNLTDILEIEVTDRTDLILRIFEVRAQSKEAKLQVAIAKGQYLLPRLAGMKEHLYSQQGGSGFRGSGEKQIELDRRQIANTINQAKRQLEKIVKTRQNQRRKRKDNQLPIVALVGYTNSGKSTLLNSFCLNRDKQVLQQDMLFATLQTATRHITINNCPCLMTDTVGFINRLPHQLIDSFRSTLEEVVEADLLIHVVDSSNENYDQCIQTTNAVLKEIGVKDTPMIYAYNKIDLNKYGLIIPQEPYVFISAKEKKGLDQLEKQISAILFKDYAIYQLNIPYQDGEVFKYLHQHCLVLESKYLENSIYLKLSAHPSFISRYSQYLLKN
ncbi:GTPase HflX [uncultured Thomasclavelia sp.]|uniref:GTPase HflX n=1 Tax=uncultured Thomasclavelia sp. TaxID=3025759 RepID=UPI0025F26F77|nr:GTPase HflX [uncultured Thomasclavelia sp.]